MTPSDPTLKLVSATAAEPTAADELVLVSREPELRVRHDGADSRELLERCANGDLDALDVLYRRYKQDLYRLFFSRLRNPEASEDLVQETFVRAISSFSRYDPSRPLWPWLRTIGDRLCTSFLRRSVRSEPSWQDLAGQDTTENGTATTDITLESVIRREDRTRLERALGALPPKQRVLLELHTLEGWSYADIASRYGLSIPALKSVLFRARSALRQMFE